MEVIWFLRNYHPITGIIYFVYIISACAFNGQLNRRDNTMNEADVTNERDQIVSIVDELVRIGVQKF